MSESNTNLLLGGESVLDLGLGVLQLDTLEGSVLDGGLVRHLWRTGSFCAWGERVSTGTAAEKGRARQGWAEASRPPAHHLRHHRAVLLVVRWCVLEVAEVENAASAYAKHALGGGDVTHCVANAAYVHVRRASAQARPAGHATHICTGRASEARVAGAAGLLHTVTPHGACTRRQAQQEKERLCTLRALFARR